MTLFTSLDAFRAHGGTPAMPLELCPICSRIPAACRRDLEDGVVVDDRPPEMLRLERFVHGGSGGEILRCPTCHRLYLHTHWTGAPDDAHSSWRRYDVDQLFNVEWCVARRVPHHHVAVVLDELFPAHAIVWFEGAQGWSALDGANRLTALDGAATLATLIERDPPRVTGDLDLARRYAALVDAIEHPADRRHDAFDEIVWRSRLSSEDQRRIEDARAASHVGPAVAERAGEHVTVRFWVTSGRCLIWRTLTVLPGGHYQRDDRVVADDLPVERG